MVLEAFHSFKVVANSWPSLKTNGEFLQWLSENGRLMRSDPTVKKIEEPIGEAPGRHQVRTKWWDHLHQVHTKIVDQHLKKWCNHSIFEFLLYN